MGNRNLAQGSGVVAIGPLAKDPLRSRQRLELQAPARKPRPDVPLIEVLAGSADAQAIVQLFTRRGFAATAMASADELDDEQQRERAPAAAIVDFLRPDARRALARLAELEVCPVLIGIVEERELFAPPVPLDAAFVRPVDPARLFVSVVELLADRKKGRGNGHKRITGVVAMVHGNPLFETVRNELHKVVSPVCAGAVLEYVLREQGVGTRAVRKPDVDAILESGRLAAVLRGYAPVDRVCATLAQLRALLDQRA